MWLSMKKCYIDNEKHACFISQASLLHSWRIEVHWTTEKKRNVIEHTFVIIVHVTDLPSCFYLHVFSLHVFASNFELTSCI